jgi:hypothetical protein
MSGEGRAGRLQRREGWRGRRGHHSRASTKSSTAFARMENSAISMPSPIAPGAAPPSARPRTSAVNWLPGCDASPAAPSSPTSPTALYSFHRASASSSFLSCRFCFPESFVPSATLARKSASSALSVASTSPTAAPRSASFPASPSPELRLLAATRLLSAGAEGSGSSPCAPPFAPAFLSPPRVAAASPSP